MEILLQQIELLCEENDLLAALCNVSACLNQYFNNINWIGFYFWKNDELVLGPFQGKIACTHIPYGKGVCGTCAKTRKSIIVPDVHKFIDHIACDSASASEIVVPIIYYDKFIGVIDVDAPIQDRFTLQDQEVLEKIAKIIAKKIAAHQSDA